MPSKSLSLADQIAQLSNPAPTDFDPEALDASYSEHEEGSNASDDESEVSEDENAGREHYVAVGKSKLRKDEDLHLDPKYDGERISRDLLYVSGSDNDAEGDEEVSDDLGSEDDESVEAVEDVEDVSSWSSGSENNGNVALNGKAKPIANGKISKHDLAKHNEVESDSELDNDQNMNDDGMDMDDEDRSDDELDDDTEEEEEDDDDDDKDEDELEDGDEDEKESEAARRAELRKIMITEQKNVVANLSKAAKADAEKGLVVRDQRAAFDSFLNSRIKLQKAVIAINSLPPKVPKTTSESFKATEQAAVDLWNVISNLRHDMLQAREHPEAKRKATKKRKHNEIDLHTPIQETWKTMQSLESSSSSYRTKTLEKWSSKLQATTNVIPVNKKLNQSAAAVYTIASQLREQLSNTEHLVSRTRIPRASAPIQSAQDIESDPAIFDDTDFYQQLLKSLVDQRMVDTANGAAAATIDVQWTPADLAELKTKKKKKMVDTRASKGRKLRYHVHEKLQNFTTPDDTLTWHEQQIDELFSSLLGQRIQVIEDDSGEEEANGGDHEAVDNMPALRLFSNTVVA